MRRYMSFVAGALAGALVGSIIAVLYAPASGEELQARARERLSALSDEIRQAYEARMAELEAELESLRKPRKVEKEA